nr:glycosyltransferase family 39 protein [Lachnospiraceae bacterium]
MYLDFKYVSFALTALMIIYALVGRKAASRDLSGAPADPSGTPASSGMPASGGKILELIDKYWLLILAAVFAVFCFTRFYGLDKVPAGVHLDEIGYWYDAHNLAKYGTDRMGSRYPVLPASYGDGHNPLYCYMCMVMLKFVPFSVKAMRSVMGISAIPMFFAAYGIIYEIYESKRWALLGPIFVTVMPYIFAANRWGLNANQMLYVCTVMLYFLIRAVKYDKVRDYILAGVFFGISLLTYHLSYIMMPLFFVLAFLYLIAVRQFKWKNAFAAFIPFALIGMPTFIEQLVNLGLVKPFYFLGSDYPRLTSYRVGEIAPVNLITNIGNIVTLLFGDNTYNYNSVKEFGTVFWAMIPLILAGFVMALIAVFRSVKVRKADALALTLLYAISVYFGFIIVIGCNAYKGNAIYISFIIFAVAGLRFMAGSSKENADPSQPQDNASETKTSKGRSICVFLTLAVLALSFLLYSEFYFRRLNATYGFQSLFKSTEPGDMLVYEEARYNPAGDKQVYMELNYEDRDFCGWL